MSKKLKQAIYSVAFTIVICAISAFLLTTVNQLWAEKYKARQGVEKKRAVLQVFDLATEKTSASEIQNSYDTHIVEKPAEGLTTYKAEKDGELLGYAFQVAGKGRCGVIRGIMGVKTDRETIRRLVIYKQEETAGLGGKITSPEYLGQFPGKKIVGSDGSAGLVLTDDAPEGAPNAVDGISGASLTTKAMMKILNDSIKQFVVGKKLSKVEIDWPEAGYSEAPTIPSGSTAEVPATEEPDPLDAPEGVKNVAKGKPVSTGGFAIVGSPELVTDGVKKAEDGNFLQLGPGKQYVQIDLGETHEIYGIALWHYHLEPRIYKDVIIQVSDDPEFKDATTVYNNDQDNSLGIEKGDDKEYVENRYDLLVRIPKGANGQYVRCYSNGSYSGDMNHYIEVEVFGRPAK